MHALTTLTTTQKLYLDAHLHDLVELLVDDVPFGIDDLLVLLGVGDPNLCVFLKIKK